MENNRSDVLVTLIVVVAVIIIAPIVINGLLTIGATIINAFQPKIYELTVTYSDGSTKKNRGTKKELDKLISEQKTEAA